MHKTLAIRGTTISYTEKKSAGRYLRLSVYHDGSCVLSIPKRVSRELIEKFLIDKSEWILQRVNHFKKNPKMMLGRGSKKELALNKEKVHALVSLRLTHFNAVYGFTWKSITIRNQSTRWGSCSKQGNLSFNYKIVDLPEHLADYIVVHELCHLGELNHSEKFWKLVAKTLPEYKVLRKQLKNI